MQLPDTLYLAVPPTGVNWSFPGADHVQAILGWLLGAAGFACVAAVIIAAVQIAHGGGRGGEHGVKLALALIGAVVCTVSSLLVSGVGL